MIEKPSASIVQVHRRQFVIGPKTFLAHDDWKHLRVSDSVYLSHCPELRVGCARDATGTQWTLLGLAIESREDCPDPLTAITSAPTDDVPDLTGSWCGRWALVGADLLYLDASGLLGCLYGEDTEGNVWLSSSPALVSHFADSSIQGEAAQHEVHYERGISWYPPPRTRFERILRLLPSQCLNITDGKIYHRKLMPPIDPHKEYSIALQEFTQSLTTTLKRLESAVGQALWLGLTAGYDSRTLLAIAYMSDTDVRPFTRLDSRVSLADRVLPPLLAQTCHLSHVYASQTTQPANRWAIVTEHTASHVSKGDALPFLSGTRDAMTGVSFGGHGFAIASGFSNWRKLAPNVPSPQEGARQFAALMGEPQDSPAVAALCEWLEWVHSTPCPQLDWRDRLFIEQRIAGWLSAKEQLYDLIPLERFPILNSARNYSLLLGLEESRRLGPQTQLAMIRNLHPALLDYPFNPSSLEVAMRFPLRAAKIWAAK